MDSNIVKGGLADNKGIKDLANHHNVTTEKIIQQLKMGKKVEMEHTNNPKVAVEIALDHIFEDPNYYTKLKTIEPQHEASYQGNMGFEEMMRFYDIASPKQTKELETLIDRNKTKEAWKLVQRVTNTKLKGKEFESVTELHMGYPDKKDIEKLEKKLKRLRKDLNSEPKNWGKSYALSHIQEEFHNALRRSYADQTIISLILQEYVPLSTNTMKDIFGDEKVSTFHLTSPDYLKNLKKLEGRKSSIATFNKLHHSVKKLRSGPLTRGGMMVWLEGDLIARFSKDTGNKIDKQGRRWVKWENLFKNLKSPPPYSEELKILKSFAINYTNIHKDTVIDENDLKKKAKYIKTYIEYAYKFIKSHKDEILRSSTHPAEYGKKSYLYDSWNELVVNNIKIKGIVLSKERSDEEDFKTAKRLFPGAKIKVVSDVDKFKNYYKKWGGEIV